MKYKKKKLIDSKQPHNKEDEEIWLFETTNKWIIFRKTKKKRMYKFALTKKNGMFLELLQMLK